MKRKLEYGFHIFFVIMIISTLFVTAFYSNIDNGTSKTNNNLSQLNVKQDNDDSLNFFDVSDFTNTSHQINVTRSIKANQYGYTTSLTEIFLYNNATQPINAFNYTISNNELNDSKFLNFYYQEGSNNSKVESTEVIDVVEEKNSTIFVNKIPSIGNNQSISIFIKMDHLNAISFNTNDVFDESTFPYQFNISFLPLVSFPITNFKLTWEIGEGISFKMKNDSLQPTEDKFIGNFSKDDFSLVFQNLTELSSINRSLLATPEYGEYNLTFLKNRNFIPAYKPNIAENLTSYLSFNYFQQGGTKIEFTKLKTTVSISEWGYVTSKHEITIKNIGFKSGETLSTAIGGSTFPIISFYLSESITKISLRDNYGNITPRVTSMIELSKLKVEIDPRADIEQNDSYDYVLSYQEKVSDVIKGLGGGKVRLQIPLSMNFNWTIRHFEFNLLFPHGSSYNYLNVTNEIENEIIRESIGNSSISKTELLGLFNKPGFKLIFEDITPLSNIKLNIDFSPSLVYFVTTPLSICILFLALGILYAIIRNLSFGLQPKRISIEEIPLDLIKNFVKTYEEKTAIREQVLKLDRKRKSKNISAREYEQTRLILRNQQQRADRSIVTVSRKLSEEGQRYRLSMRSIEVAEANREDILKNIESLERKKTQGRIGKEAYAKLRNNYAKQLRKANNEIDKVLIDLRSLLTK